MRRPGRTRGYEMTVEEYLANGGTITKLPPGAAAYGYSSGQPLGVLPPSDFTVQGVPTIRETMFEQAKVEIKTKRPRSQAQSENFKKYREAKNAALAEARKVRIAKLVRAYHAGETVAALALEEGCLQRRIRDLLKAGGVTFEVPKVEKKPKHKPTGTPSNIAKRKQLLALHAEGLTLEEIAQRMGSSRKLIRQALIRAGAIDPDYSRAAGKTLSEAEVSEIARLYAMGHGTIALAKQFGCSKPSIKKAVLACGGEMRKSGVYAPAGKRQGGYKGRKE